MKTNLVTVATFERRAPAEQFQAWLGESGVVSEIFDPGATEKVMMLRSALAPIRLKVNEESMPTARRILAVSRDRLPGLLRCPQCGESRIEFPQTTRRFAGLGTIIGVISRMGLMQQQYYCQDCHYTWAPPPEKLASPDVERDDVLGFGSGQ